MKHASKKQTKRRRAAWFTVIAIFVAACLVFGAVLILPFVLTRLEEPMEVMGTQGKEQSLLLLVHDEQKALTGAVAVHIDTARCSVRVVGYPKQTEVTRGTVVYTLSDCYAENTEQTSACLSAVTGEQYGSVWQFSTRAVGQLAAWPGGGATITLPEAAGLLPAGEQTVSALQAAELLERTEWETAVTTQAQMHASAVALFLNQHLQPNTDLQAAFKIVTSLCDNRMTIAHYRAVEKELSTLAAALASVTVEIPMGKIVGVSPNERYIFLL